MLASCPQYMILDDHEILDSFANQPSLREHLTAGRQAYREYVHCRQQRLPCDVLYYSFDYGHARFFVLDTRTERCPEKRQMISDAQLECLKSWLIENRDRLKFVVTSVPFIAELRPDVNPDQFGPPDERSEKWCGEVYRAQRDAIIDLICKEQISRVVFLVGDMHCTYHATMRIGHPRNRIAIHEIAAGPISQIQFTSRKEFYDQFRGVTHGGNPFSVLLRSFHGSTAAAVRVTVSPSDVSPMLGWSVVPTSSTNGYKPPTMKGYITFAEGGR
jgi:phosphodiesterase/alkaline phosphatase D-like protein